MRILFFMGKGGVGKTTSAAAFGILLAKKGRKTLIASLDPAHNLGDVFNEKLGEEPKKITKNLWALEVDFEATIVRQLKELADKIKSFYGYLRVLNLDKYVDTLRYSPGVEEYAVLEKIIEIIRERGQDHDVIIFDTPPTGLTLRMMVLPFINKMWIERLIELRKAILERRRAIARIVGEKPRAIIEGKEYEMAIEESEDPVFKELVSLKKETDDIISILQNVETTGIIMVINPEVLPVVEAQRACETLKKFNLPIKAVIINKVIQLTTEIKELKSKLEEQSRAIDLAKKVFRGLHMVEVPLLPREPRGVKALEEYANYLSSLIEVLSL